MLWRFHDTGTDELKKARTSLDLILDVFLVAESPFDLSLLLALKIRSVLLDLSGDLLAQLNLLALFCLASQTLLLDLAVLSTLDLELLSAASLLLLQHSFFKVIVVLLANIDNSSSFLGRLHSLREEFLTDNLRNRILPSPVVVGLVFGAREELCDNVFVGLSDLLALLLRAQIMSTLAVLLRHRDELQPLLPSFLLLKSSLFLELNFQLLAFLRLLDLLSPGSLRLSLVLGHYLTVYVNAGTHVLGSLASSAFFLRLCHGIDSLDVAQESFFGLQLLRRLHVSLLLNLLLEVTAHL